MGCTSSTPVADQGKDTKQNALKNIKHTVHEKKNTDIKAHSESKASTDSSDKEVKQTKHSKDEKNKQSKQDEYGNIDSHARKAPSLLKNSPKKLVEYLMQAATEQKMVVRAIFIWITENIRYDTDGFFGTGPKAPSNAEDVMTCGKSVCQGYANVMELLCREANIQVKLISGYAKGFGYSVDETITTDDKTNHAWNAVQIGGKWHLIDCTWAAGHVSRTEGFLKRFKPFYFLTRPDQFITSHFPYMENDMEVSKNWQLLEKPLCLEEFSKNLKMHASAFELGFNPISHKQGLVNMKVEEVFEFRNDGNFEMDIMTEVKHLDGKSQIKQPLSTSLTKDAKTFRVTFHPNKTGTFYLRIFGKNNSIEGKYKYLFEYVVKCSQIDDKDFEYPKKYSLADQCELLKPMQYKLKANSEVEFHLTSQYLLRIMIKTTIKTVWLKVENTFKGTFITGKAGEIVRIYGSREPKGDLDCLYEFKVS